MGRSLLLLGSIVLSSCSQSPPPKPIGGKPMVLTTFTVLADMTRNVAGDRIIVESITKPGAEVHGYQPTPSDLVRSQGAQLIFDNGLNLERWADRFYENLPRVTHVTLSKGVVPISITDDRDRGKPNPHAWMSPANALIYVEQIRQALTQLDPAGQDSYKRNAAIYSDQVRAIDRKLRTALVALPVERRSLVTCEGAFSYVARDYSMAEHYLWAVNAEQQATPQRIKQTIEVVKTRKIPAVFCESTVNADAQRQVAKESGAAFGGLLFVDSLSPPEGPASTYLDLLDYNVTTIINGLQGQQLSPSSSPHSP
jgi:manganese transport system substrate-binding protein